MNQVFIIPSQTGPALQLRLRILLFLAYAILAPTSMISKRKTKSTKDQEPKTKETPKEE
uniref:Uncharacterized protein n=1 Tax=Arundo donax TaxID=35708 RepID=A0A0A9DYG3_ARUDO